MSWLDWAIDDPAPGNCGYSALNVPCEVDSSRRRGLVIHSVEGWFTYTSPSAVMRARGNSWGVTIMRSGQVWRHRPRPTFVNWHAGGPAQNIGTDGIEMEGKDQPWTEAQRASLVRVLKETQAWFGWPPYQQAGLTSRTQEGVRLALLACGYGSLWEHRWFDYTSCPSGRDDWPWLMPVLAEEREDTDMPDPIFRAPNDAHAQVGAAGKRPLGDPEEIEALKTGGAKIVDVSQALFDKIDTVTFSGEVGGGGLTFDQTVSATEQGMRNALRNAWS